MSSRWWWLVGAALAAGCAGSTDDSAEDSDTEAPVEDEEPVQPDGVWAVRYNPAQPRTCTTTYTHNLVGVTTEADNPWTITDGGDRRDSVYLALFADGADGGKVMVIEDEVYFGTPVDGGWDFAWQDAQSEDDVREHETGYRFTVEGTRSTLDQYVFTLDGDTATGTFVQSDSDEMTYTESDQWDGTVNKTNGDLPTSSGLYYTSESGKSGSVRNVWNAEDCTDAICTVTKVEDCTSTDEVVLTRTSLTAEDYAALIEASQ